jgi:hypothetical protein
VSLVDVLGGLLDAAVRSGAWRALVGLVASLPVAFVVYVAMPVAPARTWFSGAIIVLGAVVGLVWEWKAGDGDGVEPERPARYQKGKECGAGTRTDGPGGS